MVPEVRDSETPDPLRASKANGNTDLNSPNPDRPNGDFDLSRANIGTPRETDLRTRLDLSILRDAKKAIQQVRNDGVFKHISDQEIGQLLNTAKLITVQNGAELRTERKGIYVITQGKVQCYLVDAAGAHHALSEAGTGQVFGELSFLVDRSQLHEAAVYVEATEPLEVIKFNPEQFLSIINKNVGALHFLLSEQVKRLSFMNQFASHAVQLAPSKEALESRSPAQKLADLFQEKVGTWRFVIGSFGAMSAYMAYNYIAKSLEIPHWDEYPYQFLNLVLSTASGFAVPILLISQNRIAQLESAATRVVQTMLESIKGDLGSVKSDLKALRQENAALKRQLEEVLKLLKERER